MNDRFLFEAKVFAAGALWLALGTNVLAQENFSTRLTMMPIDEVNRGLVTGEGSVSASLDDETLSITGSFTGLQGPATAARLHESLDRGIRGPALYDLEVEAATGGVFSGEIELLPDQVELLLDGRLYITIYSQTAPEGNLWGWLLP
jgi:hypothetical protein